MTTIKHLLTVALLLTGSMGAMAQGERTITNARMVSIGQARVLDTYLSALHYSGPEVCYLSHTLRERPDSSLWVREIIHQGNFALLDNHSGLGGEMAGSYNFQYGWHRRVAQIAFRGSELRIDAGGNINALAGFVYNTRNSNNPAQARASVSLAPTAAATYTFFPRRPMALRYEVSVPLVGLMFSPNYGQSYYEIFTKGNYDHNLVPTWVGNAPSLRQMLTLDYRIGRTAVRIGYLGDYRQASVNHLKSHYYSHGLVVGIVRKFSIKKIQHP